MKTPYCAFNVTKQAFISLGVTVADTPFARLRGLLGKMRMRSDEAVWVVPSHGVHTIGGRYSGLSDDDRAAVLRRNASELLALGRAATTS